MAYTVGRLSERLYRVLIPEAKKAVSSVEEWAALGTLAGNVRPQNQDRLLGGQFTSIDGKMFRMAALSDGMGGLKNGQEAAALTLASLLWFLTSSNGPMDQRLVNAANYANDQLVKRFQTASGATLSAIVITSSGSATALNVGDSRVYGFRRTGGLTQISTDDTLAGLAKQGVGIDSRHNTNALLQHIGMGEGLEPHVFEVTDTSIYKYFVLTTDGVHWVGNRLLGLIADNADDHVQYTRRLLNLAEMTGAHDNASVAAICPLPFTSNGDSLADDTIDMDLWTPQARTVMMSERHNVTPIPVTPAHRSRTSEGQFEAQVPVLSEPDARESSPNMQPSPKTEQASKRPRKGKPKAKRASPERDPLERPALFIEFDARKQDND